MVSVPLSSSLEAQGHFKANVLGWLLGAACIGIGAWATSHSADSRDAMWGLLAAAVLPIAIYTLALARSGSLEPGRLFRGAIPIAGLQIAASVLLTAGTSSSSGDPWDFVLVATVGVVELGLLWRLRGRTAFGAVASAYGLPGFR